MTNEEYIRQHREDDVRQLALAKAPEGVDAKWCLQQIEGWQIARRKLPTWAATAGLWYPPRLSMEQCSGEETARYKRSLVERLLPEGERQSMADLTGGLGVDFSFLAPLFREATYVEIQPHLLALAQHNMPLLISRPSPLTTIFIPPTPHLPRHDFLFLDPARRDGAGQKTVAIRDCTPNLLDMQDELLAQARYVMVKLSPMLDIRQALRELRGVSEVHVVSVRGECKELLFVMEGEGQKPLALSPLPLSFHCVNLGTDDDVIVEDGEMEERKDGNSISQSLNSSVFQFLYEPNASVLKAGVQDVLCARYAVRKLHPMSHLFVADRLVPRFPGRRFRVVGWGDFSKKSLRALLGDLRQANLTVRNFPTPVAQLRRQLRLAEGGDTYLFATTLADNRHVLIRCERASCE